MEIFKKTAVVTGASSGLGSACAEALVSKGVIVYGIARNPEKLEALQKTLGNDFIPTNLDITIAEAVGQWIERAFSDHNLPDILINNASAGYFSKIDGLTLERWHQMINTNLNGAFYITSKIVPLMKQNQNTCHIINIGSILGKTSRAEGAAYSTTKFGIQGFSESLVKELRSYKIKVTCVNPGSIETNFFEESGIKSHHNMLQPNDIAKLIIYILETPDNFLIDEITLRPLIPAPPD